jgi:hypothetical protein
LRSGGRQMEEMGRALLPNGHAMKTPQMAAIGIPTRCGRRQGARIDEMLPRSRDTR